MTFTSGRTYSEETIGYGHTNITDNNSHSIRHCKMHAASYEIRGRPFSHTLDADQFRLSAIHEYHDFRKDTVRKYDSMTT